MSVERLARKSFVFVVAFLLAVAIYFQAAGAVEFVAAKVLVDSPSAATKAPRPSRSKPAVHASSTSGDPILARNAFDSVTGPLDKAPVRVELPDATKNPVDLSDPLRVPECEDVQLDIVSESPDSAWSLAQLKGQGETDFSTRRVGDAVGKLKVVYIGFNPAKGSPAVWLEGDKLCQALLFSEKAQKAKDATASSTPAPAPPAPSNGRPTAPQVPASISDKIAKISETQFKIDRSVIDSILENQAQLMRTARIVPEQKDGKTVGIRLFGIRSDTLLGTLGMQNGDRLEQINGFDMASPEKALEAYARLRTATSLTVQITRRGKPLTIDYQIN